MQDPRHLTRCAYLSPQILQIIQLLKARREERRLEALRMASDDNGSDYDPVT